MYVDSIVWYKYKILTSSCLIFLLVRFILIVGKIYFFLIIIKLIIIIQYLDSAKPGNPSTSRQMCLKVCHNYLILLNYLVRKKKVRYIFILSRLYQKINFNFIYRIVSIIVICCKKYCAL